VRATLARAPRLLRWLLRRLPQDVAEAAARRRG